MLTSESEKCTFGKSTINEIYHDGTSGESQCDYRNRTKRILNMGRDKKGLPLCKIHRSLGDCNRGAYKNINRRAAFRLEDVSFTITGVLEERINIYVGMN